MAPFWFKRRARSDAPHLALPNSRHSKPAGMLTTRPWIWLSFHGSTGWHADALTFQRMWALKKLPSTSHHYRWDSFEGANRLLSPTRPRSINWPQGDRPVVGM